MWIYEVENLEFYQVRAQSHGPGYYTDFFLVRSGISDSSGFSLFCGYSDPGSENSKLPFGWILKGAKKKHYRRILRIYKSCRTS